MKCVKKLEESSIEAKERAAEYEKQRQEAGAKSDKEWVEIRANQKKTDEQIKAMQEELGGIGRSNGAVADETIFNSLDKDMFFAGIEFEEIEKNIENQLASKVNIIF